MSATGSSQSAVNVNEIPIKTNHNNNDWRIGSSYPQATGSMKINNSMLTDNTVSSYCPPPSWSTNQLSDIRGIQSTPKSRAKVVMHASSLSSAPEFTISHVDNDKDEGKKFRSSNIQMNMANKVRFSISEPEFDQSTFGGRFKSSLRVSNQFHAYYSKKRIREMEALVDNQKAQEEKNF